MTRRPPLYRPRLLERVEVVWKDARMDFDYDGPAEAHPGTLARLSSMGYFVSSDRQKYVIASTQDLDDHGVRLLLNIPRKLIVEVLPLGQGDAKAAPDEVLGQG